MMLLNDPVALLAKYTVASNQGFLLAARTTLNSMTEIHHQQFSNFSINRELTVFYFWWDIGIKSDFLDLDLVFWGRHLFWPLHVCIKVEPFICEHLLTNIIIYGQNVSMPKYCVFPKKNHIYGEENFPSETFGEFMKNEWVFK